MMCATDIDSNLPDNTLVFSITTFVTIVLGLVLWGAGIHPVGSEFGYSFCVTTLGALCFLVGGVLAHWAEHGVVPFKNSSL